MLQKLMERVSGFGPGHLEGSSTARGAALLGTLMVPSPGDSEAVVIVAIILNFEIGYVVCNVCVKYSVIIVKERCL